MINKPTLAIVAISAGLFLSTSVQAFDLYSATDDNTKATEVNNQKPTPEKTKFEKMRELRKANKEKREAARKAKASKPKAAKPARSTKSAKTTTTPGSNAATPYKPSSTSVQ